MRITHLNSTWSPNEGRYKNCLVLYDDNWNDYGYRTSFRADYFNHKGEKNEIGEVKIYYYDFDENRKNHTIPVSSVIGEEITQLDEKFCSLGQSLTYYQNLKDACPDDYLDILNRLNDIAINSDLKSKFINEKGVQASLLRDSSAEKALNEAGVFLKTKELVQKDISFTYYATVPYNENKTKLCFNFTKDANLPYRVNVLIGKNGVGKTQILFQLAEEISGINSTFQRKKDVFEGKRPPVDKIISISYSAFDKFRKRKSDNNAYRDTSYSYCGIQSEHGTLSLKELKNNFITALNTIRKKNRYDSWKSIMQVLIEKEHLDLIENAESEEMDEIQWSSGQNVLLCTITEAIATIEKESLLLFDEPEIHLHPNAVSNVMRMLYRLLEEFDSYAIFATHSPLIVQEIPSKYVQILTRIDNVLSVRSPVLECFGENVTNITNDIFDVNSTESNYKTVLYDLSINKKKSFEEILEIFGGTLSLNALIYLNSCYGNNIRL